MPQGPNIDDARHSLAHLLAMAVLKEFPKAQLGIGPAIEHGFYYDFKLPKPITTEDLPALEQKMRSLITSGLPFRGERITPSRARALFNGQPFKLELIKDFAKEKKQLTVYYTGHRTLEAGGRKLEDRNRTEAFTDLCKGGHVKNTSEINPDAFALTHIAGAYWKGDEKNPMLTRVYGVAFNTMEERDAHIARMEEARKRDHKRLGPELDLFTFSDLVGSGLPLWTPKGTVLRDVLDSRVWNLRKARGYERVDIPHLTKKDLYVRSGHWDKFKDELFQITTREGHLLAVKPMNCPHHVQIYTRKQWSWRELPQRYASTTKQYRDEQTGELAGLARVRSITIDDAHVFCRRGAVKSEIRTVWDMIDEFYGAFGFELSVRLSLRDPNRAKQYLGTPAIWSESEATLRNLASERGARAFEAPGEAAFYGPKIDFLATDSIGREWQVATIQLDMNQPERFDLYCVNEQGAHERIVMIHAAIMGSIERFLAILIEHYAGAFPVWLAPVQVAILPIGESHRAYADTVHRTLAAADIRAELRDAGDSLGKRIRAAELQKIPYLLIVGDKEQNAKAVSVRKRGKGDLGAMPIAQLLEYIANESRPTIEPA